MNKTILPLLLLIGSASLFQVSNALSMESLVEYLPQILQLLRQFNPQRNNERFSPVYQPPPQYRQPPPQYRQPPPQNSQPPPQNAQPPQQEFQSPPQNSQPPPQNSQPPPQRARVAPPQRFVPQQRFVPPQYFAPRPSFSLPQSPPMRNLAMMEWMEDFI